jgi:IS5 family transposase
MRPKNSKPNPQSELFRIELKRIVDMNHALVKLAERIEWTRFDRAFGPCYCPDFGRPANPTRLMVGLHYLKYTYELSDEMVLEGWLENPYWQYFCGGQFFEHELPIEVSSMSRWRKKIAEAGAEELLAELIRSGLKAGAIEVHDLKRVNVDTTVQTKAVRHPTDARLYDRMRERLAKAAQEASIDLRQSYERVGKKAFHRQSSYARAGQYKRAGKETRKLKTYLGRIVRDIERKSEVLDANMAELLQVAHRLLEQERDDKHKLYSVHAPEVECIAKGKAHKRYEFGCKMGLVTTARGNWIVGATAFHGNPYDGHTLTKSLTQAERITGIAPSQATCDLGYRGHNYEGACTIEIVPRNKKSHSRWKRFWWKRRSAIEPVIGHMKSEHGLERNRLKGITGDRINALLAACGFNMRKLLRAFLRLIRLWLNSVISPTTAENQTPYVYTNLKN